MNRIFLSCFIIFTAFGATLEKREFIPVEDGDWISKDLRYGSFLIFDCEELHFACVDKKSFEECILRRDTAKRRFKDKLDCAPLREFKESEECRLEQYRYIHLSPIPNFCLREYSLSRDIPNH